MTAPAVSSRRPYLLRAMHEWMTDNNHTPHLVVDAEVQGVVVPRAYVRDGKIVLNVSYQATGGLEIRNDFVTFSARFAGVSHDISLPLAAVLGIYARETGQGMIFQEGETPPNAPVDPLPPSNSPKPGPATAGSDPPKSRARLKVVK